MRRNARIVPIVLVLAAALSACGSDSSESSVAGVDDDLAILDETDLVDDLADSSDEDGLDADLLARFASCADVEPFVAQYIGGLQENPSNTVDGYGVYCSWETPDGAVDFSQIREVEVMVEPGGGEVPSAATLQAGKLVVLPDAALEESGGVAYTLPTTTAVAAAIVTTVALPDVKVTIGGGQWGDLPALDGPAAVAVAKELLGM